MGDDILESPSLHCGGFHFGQTSDNHSALQLICQTLEHRPSRLIFLLTCKVANPDDCLKSPTEAVKDGWNRKKEFGYGSPGESVEKISALHWGRVELRYGWRRGCRFHVSHWQGGGHGGLPSCHLEA